MDANKTQIIYTTVSDIISKLTDQVSIEIITSQYKNLFERYEMLQSRNWIKMDVKRKNILIKKYGYENDCSINFTGGDDDIMYVSKQYKKLFFIECGDSITDFLINTNEEDKYTYQLFLEGFYDADRDYYNEKTIESYWNDNDEEIKTTKVFVDNSQYKINFNN